MELKQLTVEPRTKTGKGGGRSLRREGKIPSVIYGAGKDPQNGVMVAHDIEYVMSHDIRDYPMVSLKCTDTGEEIPALIKDIQRHPVSGAILHADLMRLTMDKKMTFSVRVELVGTPIGVRQGGALEQLINSITVHCLPDMAPALVYANINDLAIGQKLTVSDLGISEDLEVQEEFDDAVVVVKATREALPEEEEAAEGAEGEGEAAEGEAAEGEAKESSES